MVGGEGWRSKITIDASETKSDFQVGLYSKIKRERDPKTLAPNIINLLMLV